MQSKHSLLEYLHNNLRQFFTRRCFKRGESFIIDAEKTDQFVYVVDHGVFKVVSPNIEGNEILKWLLKPGDTGLHPYRHESGNNPADLNAVTKGALWIASYSKIAAIAKTDVNLSGFINTAYQNFEKAKESRFLDQRTLSAWQRYEKLVEHLGELATKVPQYELANYVGVSPVQLSRLRKKYHHNINMGK